MTVKKKVLAVRSEGVYHRPLASSLPLLLLGPFQHLIEYALAGGSLSRKVFSAIRLHPVLKAKARYAFKFLDIIGHQNKP